MTFNLKDVLNSVSAFAGVNPGYASEDARINDPAQAAAVVRKVVTDSGMKADVYLGLIVYNHAWENSTGREVIGAIFNQQPSENFMEEFKHVKSTLEQVSLSVITPHIINVETLGFVAQFPEGSDLNVIVTAWQKAATEQYNQSGTYISGAIYEADNQIFAQAEANPNRISNIEIWRKAAINVMKQIPNGTDFQFRTVGFNYFRTPGL